MPRTISICINLLTPSRQGFACLRFSLRLCDLARVDFDGLVDSQAGAFHSQSFPSSGPMQFFRACPNQPRRDATFAAGPGIAASESRTILEAADLVVMTSNAPWSGIGRLHGLSQHHVYGKENRTDETNQIHIGRHQHHIRIVCLGRDKLCRHDGRHAQRLQ